MAQAGVTRLAVLTGLDRVGVPTVAAVRPAAPTLAVMAGKGLDLDAACASAALEAIETYHAEQADVPLLMLPYAALAADYSTIPIERLAVRRHAIFDSRVAERWTVGWDLLQRCVAAVPFDHVVLGRSDPTWIPGSFRSTSNGLAAGATATEALVVALLEVIERDAVACHRVAARLGRRPLARVKLETATGWPLAADLLERFDRADIQPLVFDCRVDTGVPVFWAVVYDRSARGVGLFHGSGAHLDPEVALVRALLEAAQSRAVYISGARDDVSMRAMVRLRSLDRPATIDALTSHPAVVDLTTFDSVAGATFETDLACLIDRLKNIGIDQLVALELTMPAFAGKAAVVRVVVPGLDGVGFECGDPSPRAEAFVCGCPP